MTITFKNGNDGIVYALEKLIAYARSTQQIFAAQCVWWLASIIGLEQGSIAHIDNLRKSSEESRVKDMDLSADSESSNREGKQPSPLFTNQSVREVSTIPRDIQEDPRIDNETRYLHLERVSQVQDINNDVSDLNLDSSKNDQRCRIVQSTELLISRSRRERRKLEKQKQSDPLSRTRSGQVPVKRSNQDFSKTEGIDPSELIPRKAAGECLRCAWPSDRKGNHKVKDCRRKVKLDKGTANFPKAKKYQTEETEYVELGNRIYGCTHP